MRPNDFFLQLGDLFRESPTSAVALLAAGIALASTPLAFALMGGMKWFNARRGRTLQRPSWWSVVCSMMMVMGIPAILLAVMLKGEHYDQKRYEFDPNRTITPVDEGRRYEVLDRLKSAEMLDEAVRAEEKRLAEVRRDLVNSVKSLDTAMLALREAAIANPAVVPEMNEVLERMGKVRKSIGLDAPQQQIIVQAKPAEMGAGAPASSGAPAAPVAAREVAPPAPPPASGLAKPAIEAIVAAVPAPQKALAEMLPLSDLPAGWNLSKLPGVSPPKYVETFNAENLYEKMDGRAESFIQNGVKGMACCSYHPGKDEDAEVQLFVFEMGDALRAGAKFDSEKPDDAKPTELGDGAYTASGSVFFHLGPYYTVVNLAQDDPKLSAFALDLARRVASGQKAGPAASGPSPTTCSSCCRRSRSSRRRSSWRRTSSDSAS